MRRPRALPCCSLWLLLSLACAETPTDSPALPADDAAVGVDAGLFVGADAGAPRDAEPPANTALPVDRSAVYSISEPGAIDLYGVVFEAEHTQHVYYERFDEPFTRGRLYVSTSTGASFSPPEEVSLGSANLRGSPSVVRDRLYFAEAGAIGAAVSVSFAVFENGVFSSPAALPAIPGLATILSWPRFIAAGGDKTAVVFRDGDGRGRVALSEDGENFDAPVRVGSGALAQPELAVRPGGGFLFAFQTPVGNQPMVSFFQLSPDGLDWSTPAVRLSTSSANVHDARYFLREDGELDAYYIYPAGLPGFSLFRRKVAADGALGPEQQITVSALGDATKPAPHRLRDGSILLLFAEITARAPQGYPTEQVLRALRLRGDAPF